MNEAFKPDDSRLPDAAARGSASLVAGLIDGGYSIEARDQKGRTALHRAARVGRYESVDLLISRGADVLAQDARGEMALQMAARYGHLEVVEILLKHGSPIDYYPPPEKTDYSETALCSACRKGQEAIAETLLQFGADPNAASASRRLPLHGAIFSGKHTLIEALLAKGADPIGWDQFGQSPLHAAVSASDEFTIRLLLERGVAVDLQAKNGEVALFQATNYSPPSLAVITTLLEFHPDLERKDPISRRTALKNAVERGRSSIEQLLIEAGAKAGRSKQHSSGGQVSEVTSFDKAEMDTDADEDDEGEEGEFPYLRPTDADESLAAQVRQEALQGWASSDTLLSRPHRRMLERATTPLNLFYLAYSARGSFHSYDGVPLSDGEKVLGEAYLSAAARFIDLGFLSIVSPEETLMLCCTAAELSEWIKARGERPAKTKGLMIDQIVRIGGMPALTELQSGRFYYVRTTVGTEALGHVADVKTSMLKMIRNDLKKSIVEGNMTAVARALVEFANCFDSPPLNAGDLAHLRHLKSDSWPEDIDPCGYEREVLLAAVAASSVHSGEAWADWGVERPPIRFHPPIIDVPRCEFPAEELQSLIAEAKECGEEPSNEDIEEWFNPKWEPITTPGHLWSLFCCKHDEASK